MALIHILDRRNDEIIGTLNFDKGEYWEAVRHDSLNAENTLDFRCNASLEKAELLKERNRLLAQDEDGFFLEYIINYAEQNKRKEKVVRADASFVDIRKAKVIEPQTLVGTTSELAVSFALSGSEWEPGNIEFTGTADIKIENYTNPLDLIKTIASTFELEISFRIEVRGNKVTGRYVDIKKEAAGFEGKEIVYGKDLVGLRRKEDNGAIITALYGVYKKTDGTTLTVWVQDEEAFQRWGRNGQHLVDWYQPDSTDEEMTIEKLTALTQVELKKRIDSIVSYEGEAVSIEHVFGREHEKIRVGQKVRMKDIGYNPPLYLEARIQEVDVDQSTGKILGFKIFNFKEYSKADLEKQISSLKQLMEQKAALAEKIIVSSSSPPQNPIINQKYIDISDPDMEIIKKFNGSEWVEIGRNDFNQINGRPITMNLANGKFVVDVNGNATFGGKINSDDISIKRGTNSQAQILFESKAGGQFLFYTSAFNESMWLQHKEVTTGLITTIANFDRNSVDIYSPILEADKLEGRNGTKPTLSQGVYVESIDSVSGNPVSFPDGISSSIPLTLLTPYTLFTPVGGWVAYGGSPVYSYPAYYQTADGKVHLTGNMKNGANGQFWTVPTTLRPLNKLAFNVNCGNGYQSGYVTIESSGIVYISVPSGANGWVVLDGISWRPN